MIRSITLGIPLFHSSLHEIESVLSCFQQQAQELLIERQWPVRTSRITLPPLCDTQEDEAHLLPAQLASVSRIAEKADVRWFCLPVDLVHGQNIDQRLNILLGSLTKTNRMFINLMIADENNISIKGAKEAADFVLSVSKKSNNGFDNFRVGASCCCPANAPFFPFSRHEGEDFRFSLALEVADIALSLSEQVKSHQIDLAQFQNDLIDYLQQRLTQIDEFAQILSQRSKVKYAGLDASLAPFPDGETSIGRLLENLGASPVGGPGTIFITSLLTDAIKTAIKRSGVLATGFNGVMYSVLEDDYLAKANSRHQLDINALNAFSTVCGCGLDMIPIPGTTFVEDIMAIMLDTAALAVRLKKPLGIRLLPIPNKLVNERTEFNLDFLCDSRIMDITMGNMGFHHQSALWQYAHCKTL